MPSTSAVCTEADPAPASERARLPRAAWLFALLVFCGVVLAPALHAAPPYRELSTPISVEGDRERVLLITLPCPACADLVPELEAAESGRWAVIPAVFDTRSMHMARAYHVIDHCGFGAPARRVLMTTPRAQAEPEQLAAILHKAAEPDRSNRCQTLQTTIDAFEAAPVLQAVQQGLAWSRIVAPAELPALVIGGRWVMEHLAGADLGEVRDQAERLLKRARAYKEQHGGPGNG